MKFQFTFILSVLNIFIFWYGRINFFNKKVGSELNNFENNFKINLFFIKWKFFFCKNKNLPFFSEKTLFYNLSNSVPRKKKFKCPKLINCAKNLTLFNEFNNFSNEKKEFYSKELTGFFENSFFLLFTFKTFNGILNLRKINNLNKIPRIVNFKKINPYLNHSCRNFREKILKKRFDFRKFETFSIDPIGTIETDDLIHYRFIKTGAFHEFGLHIPDIYSLLYRNDDFFYTLKENNGSKFLLNRKFSLFHSFLSKNCFSLHQNIDRISFSTIFLSDCYGKIKKIKLVRSLIRNKRLFSKIKISDNLKKIKNLNENKDDKCFFSKKLLIVENLCFRLKSMRIKSKGNCDFFLKFETLDKYKKLNFRENLKEELNILSNITIAEKIIEFFPNCTELRSVRFLKIKNFSKFFLFSKIFSVNLDFSSFKKLIKNVQFLINLERMIFFELGRKFRFYGKSIKKMTLFYCPIYNYKSTLDKINWGPLYVQTSSPIRRFGDILIQKKLLNYY
jgi:exoribonuclease R